MYVDDAKLFAKNQKELETLIQTIRIYSHDTRMEFGKKIMCHTNHEKRKR